MEMQAVENVFLHLPAGLELVNCRGSATIKNGTVTVFLRKPHLKLEALSDWSVDLAYVRGTEYFYNIRFNGPFSVTPSQHEV